MRSRGRLHGEPSAPTSLHARETTPRCFKGTGALVRGHVSAAGPHPLSAATSTKRALARTHPTTATTVCGLRRRTLRGGISTLHAREDAPEHARARVGDARSERRDPRRDLERGRVGFDVAHPRARLVGSRINRASPRSEPRGQVRAHARRADLELRLGERRRALGVCLQVARGRARTRVRGYRARTSSRADPDFPHRVRSLAHVGRRGQSPRFFNNRHDVENGAVASASGGEGGRWGARSPGWLRAHGR